MKFNFTLKTVLVITGLLASSFLWAVESALWTQFIQAKQSGSEPTLPDFSYAGYDYSKTPIPNTSGWTRFDVTEYGAVADDSGYDDNAIQATIEAAEEAGGGVVFFPAGRFMVSPNETVGENIFIHGSNIVLKGSGSGAGGTEIFMDKMKPRNGRHIFEILPTDTSENTITTVVRDALRESYVIEVADASGLNVGQRIILSSNSTELAHSFYSPQQIDPLWTRLLDTGFNLREIHTVESIDGNSVHLREPLHLSLTIGDVPIAVRSYNMIQNIGIEDILFKGNWDSYPESFVHHRNEIHDYAWNAIRMDNVENGWIRNAEFKDWNQVIYIDGSAAITIENILLSGKKGHASIHARRSYGVLVKDSRDIAGHHHGPGLGYWGTGTVYLRYKMAPNQQMDSHSGSPYATLFDNVSNGHFSGNGGPHPSYPHHGKHFVAWNFKLAGGPRTYDFWPSRRNANTFAMPYFIGLQGKSIEMKEGTFAVNELPGEAVEPGSLFDAQLQLRLSTMAQADSDSDGIPDAIEAAGLSGAIDTDDDGLANHRDSDSDNDSISDAVEGMVDTDNDGTPNYIDTDSDDDGISDATEGSIDSDTDGMPDYLDSDSDNDGIADVIEGDVDSDGDGILDYLDADDSRNDINTDTNADTGTNENTDSEAETVESGATGTDANIGTDMETDIDTDTTPVLRVGGGSSDIWMYFLVLIVFRCGFRRRRNENEKGSGQFYNIKIVIPCYGKPVR